MEKEQTIKDITELTEGASTSFEKANTELKRKYLIWNIEAFNMIVSTVSVNRGPFGTGYPFYALDDKLQGEIPIITEQIRYNRQLVKDGEPVQKSIWACKACIEKNYELMPDLKTICKPCPNMLDTLKPRKIINRLPDLDMWLVCKEGTVKQAQEELTDLLDKYNMRTSDIDPLKSLDDVVKIATSLKDGKFPRIFLPIDTHIVDVSTLKALIEQVPNELKKAKEEERKPYLPIQPISLRKKWQYEDEAYNFILDFLLSFTDFNFVGSLEKSLKESRAKILEQNTPEELLECLQKIASPATFRRIQEPKIEETFLKKVANWRDEPQSKIEQVDKGITTVPAFPEEEGGR